MIAVAAAGIVDAEAMAFAETTLEAALHLPARRAAPLADPVWAFDAKRQQYSSTLVLREALPRVPPDAVRLAVLTERDLFIPMLSFVFGQAQLDGPVAVISLARLRQEFYGLPPNHALFLDRLRKEVLHEIGHTFGLTHCADPLCTMTLSTNIQQVDSKTAGFCDGCAALLRDAVAHSGAEVTT